MSLQGKNPLPGHPKTLRDLTHISEMLTLPSAFGAIQLGETFSGCLSVNNEASIDIEGVTLRVEMQTATTKNILGEYGGPNHRLATGDTMECVVNHEIKELGQHVLACTVSYRLPEGHRSMHPTPDNQGPNIQSFRKFYKFAVTNPLSVKTKVNVPRSPTAMFSPTEREKVFLEVHIQNLTPDALWLQKIRFECVDGWQSIDANRLTLADDSDGADLFSDSMALIHPQDTRQYVYILSPKAIPAFPITHAPGTIIPLGRLDISWRSAFGEPGRLLTSMLSRRIPLIQASHAGTSSTLSQAKQPASALPLHLQRGSVTGTGTPPRVGSPQLGQRPKTPPIAGSGVAPYRPGSPFRSRTNTTMSLPNPISPNIPFTPNPAVRRPDESVDADLIVRYLPRDDLVAQKPFRIAFTVSVAAPVPPPKLGQPRKQRVISLAIQHVQPPPVQPPPVPSAPSITNADSWSPRLPSSGFSSPSPYNTPYRGDFPESLAQRLMNASPRQALVDLDLDSNTDTDGRDTVDEAPAPAAPRDDIASTLLPPPFAVPEGGHPVGAQSKDVVFLGPSAIFLPQIRLSAPPAVQAGAAHGHERTVSESTTDSEADSDLHETIGGSVVRSLAVQDFELEFMPLRSGFANVGGLRVLLVEDRLVDADEDSGERTGHFNDVRTLREWDVVAEIWVKTAV
ncbi:hypothetical protein EIP86_011518 [Pleurotus ostreatoroseus]|nr:hypothetical protein EIP86_011518 [Pleurotus ostreatoroseus]